MSSVKSQEVEYGQGFQCQGHDGVFFLSGGQVAACITHMESFQILESDLGSIWVSSEQLTGNTETSPEQSRKGFLTGPVCLLQPCEMACRPQ